VPTLSYGEGRLSDENTVSNGGAGWILVAAGAITIVWALLYFVWSLIGFVTGGITALLGIAVVFDSGDPLLMIQGLFGVLAPVIQMIAYFLIVLLAGIGIFGGVRLNQFKSYGTARLGAVAITAGPVLGLLASLTAFCNFAGFPCCCLSFVIGNIPTLVLTLLCLGATIYAFVVMKREEVQAAFAVNDAEA